MKLRKAALLASLLFTTDTSFAVGTTGTSNNPTRAEDQLVKTTSEIVTENWMYLSIGAIILVLFVLVILIFWVRRRGKKKS